MIKNGIVETRHFFRFLITKPCPILRNMAEGEVAEWPNAAVC